PRRSLLLPHLPPPSPRLAHRHQGRRMVRRQHPPRHARPPPLHPPRPSRPHVRRRRPLRPRPPRLRPRRPLPRLLAHAPHRQRPRRLPVPLHEAPTARLLGLRPPPLMGGGVPLIAVRVLRASLA